MTEERYTLGDAEILARRLYCLEHGHDLRPLAYRAMGGWCSTEPLSLALEPELDYQCARCDASVRVTYPPLGTQDSRHGGFAATDLSVEPVEFAHVSFEDKGGTVRTFDRFYVPSMRTGQPGVVWVYSPSPNACASLTWPEVVLHADGAPIHAWNDGEWVRGEAVAPTGVMLADLTTEPAIPWVGFHDGTKVQVFEMQDSPVQTLAHQLMWARNGRIDQTFTWRQVIAAAKGAPIYASTDAAWIEREAKP